MSQTGGKDGGGKMGWGGEGGRQEEQGRKEGRRAGRMNCQG